MTARRYRGPLVVWVLLVAYASLYPFLPLRMPGPGALHEFFAKPRYVIAFDVALNVVAYIPLGAFAALFFGGEGERRGGALKGAAFGALLSFAMESSQLFLPGRIASLYDVFANTGGAILGAGAFADPFYSVLTRPLGRWREGVFIPGSWGDAGLVLLALWLLAQLNPALPFFGAGNIAAAGDAAPEAGVLDGAAVAPGIVGFGLFVSTVLRGEQGTLRVTIVLLSAALWLKFVTASLMLQPHFSDEWVTGGRFVGLAVGLALLAPLRRLPRAWRMYVATLAILAGALLSKIFGAYSPLVELLQLFRWPHGQLANFTTLTRFLHELWPLAALTFLVALFLRDRRAAHAIIAR
jgi:VanZ family protein